MAEDLADQLRIFTKSSVGPLPAGIGNHICHVHIALLKSCGIPFSADTVCKIIHKIDGISLHCGGNAKGSRPRGKNSCRIIHTEYQLAILISGIGYYLHRNEVLTFLCHCVKLIQPVCQIFRRGICAKNQMARKPFLN